MDALIKIREFTSEENSDNLGTYSQKDLYKLLAGPTNSLKVEMVDRKDFKTILREDDTIFRGYQIETITDPKQQNLPNNCMFFIVR